MEKFEECRQKAQRYLSVADHMLTQTYPMIRDPKLLLAVMENVFLSVTNGMSTMLYFERYNKVIPPFNDSFASKFDIFKFKIADKYNMKNFVPLINDVKSVIADHKQAPVEFARKDVYVICSDDYRLKTIGIPQIKDYIYKTKDFLNTVSMVTKNERVFARG